MSYVPVSHIEAVFAGMRTVRQMALDGYDEPAIARELQWRREDIRAAARLQGFSTSALVPKQRLCPACGYVLMPNGDCEICRLRLRLHRLESVNAEEHRREVERLENAIDAEKQDTCRTRRRMGTSPRR